MELTDKEFVDILDELMSSSDEDELLDESYQEFKDSDYEDTDDEEEE